MVILSMIFKFLKDVLLFFFVFMWWLIVVVDVVMVFDRKIFVGINLLLNFGLLEGWLRCLMLFGDIIKSL